MPLPFRPTISVRPGPGVRLRVTGAAIPRNPATLTLDRYAPTGSSSFRVLGDEAGRPGAFVDEACERLVAVAGGEDVDCPVFQIRTVLRELAKDRELEVHVHPVVLKVAASHNPHL